MVAVVVVPIENKTTLVAMVFSEKKLCTALGLKKIMPS
jgi:hypothetical protein